MCCEVSSVSGEDEYKYNSNIFFYSVVSNLTCPRHLHFSTYDTVYSCPVHFSNGVLDWYK